MERVSFRRRHFVFSREDAAAFSELLRDAFPDVRFFDAPTQREIASENPTPPELHILRSLADARQPQVDIQFDPHWKPQWKPPGAANWWVLMAAPWPSGEVDLGGGVFQNRDGPPHMAGGYVYFRCEPGNKAHASLASKALRLISKIATNRYQAVRYPSYEVIWSLDKGGLFWLGHHAIRWARESPDRLLHYSSHQKIGYRPLD